MRFRVLGPLEVDDGDAGPTTIGSHNQRVVLGLLLVEPGRTVPTDRLVEALWGDAPPPTAVRTLRTYVSRLRRVVGDRLVTTGGGYCLDVPPSDVDAHRFAEAARAATSVHDLTDALAAWRGPAFGGLDGIDALEVEARRLDELRDLARERLASAQLEAGCPADAVATVEALVADDPYREAAWATAVRALTVASRPADALRTYQRAVAALAAAGLEPSSLLRDAEQAALAGDAVAGADRPTHPPGPPTAIVGRDDDVERIGALLARAPLVTLVGPGGVGKTRLSLDVARRFAGRHRLGARIVELAEVVEDAAVASALVDGLGMTDEGVDPVEALRRAGSLDVLVVLDNCEHVIDAVAAAVEHVTGAGAQIRVLATSRERLGVDGEHSWSVAPLATVGSDAPAAELFRVRAAAAAPDLDVGPGTDEVVRRIVTRLDGLPLAIEMAAARTATMGLGELADALDERLDLLASPRRRGDERHRTLAHVIQWSEALLEPELRELLAAVSVFAGSVPAGDVVGVLDDPSAADGIRALAERSLVTVERGTERSRYGMLNTVRTYARGRRVASGRDDALQRAHADWYIDAARHAHLLLTSPREREGHDRIEEVFAELRAVHRRTRRTDPGRAAALSDALLTYTYSRMRSEPTVWARQVVDAAGAVPAAAGAHVTVANGLANAGDLAGARATADRALDLAGVSAVTPFAYLTLSDVSLYQGQLDRAIDEARRMADAALAVDDVYHAVFGTGQESICLTYAGRRTDALAELDALDVPEVDLAPTLVGWIAYARGEALADDEPDDALGWLARAAELGDAVGNAFLGAVARVSTAALLARAGDPAEAARRFVPIVEHWLELGNRTHLLTTLRNLVGLLLRVGAPGAGAELVGSLSAGASVPTYGEEADRMAGWEADIRAALGEGEARRLSEQGRSRDLDDAARTAITVLAQLSR